MKNLFKKIGVGISSAWKWMDGKKTIIGGVVSGLTLVASGVFPIHANIINGILILSGTLTGVGGVHKVVKNKELITNTYNSVVKSK